MKRFLKTVALFLIVSTASFLGMHLYTRYVSDWMGWKITSEWCQVLFFCSPSEFSELDYESFGLPENVRNKAYIDDVGDLKIILSRKDAKEWRESPFLNDFGENPRISFDPDAGVLILFAYLETYSDDIIECDRILCKKWISLGLEGIREDARGLKLVIQDGVSGEVFYNSIWTPEPRDISVSEWNMSSFPEN